MASQFGKISPDVPPRYSPSQDTTDRFSIDQLMRNHGYSIHQRKGDHEPLWIKRGVVYPQSEILSNHINSDEVMCALYLDQIDD